MHVFQVLEIASEVYFCVYYFWIFPLSVQQGANVGSLVWLEIKSYFIVS